MFYQRDLLRHVSGYIQTYRATLQSRDVDEMDVSFFHDSHVPVQHTGSGRSKTILPRHDIQRFGKRVLRGIRCDIPRLSLYPDRVETHPPDNNQHVQLRPTPRCRHTGNPYGTRPPHVG